MTIGVLALQGAFRAHAQKLGQLGVEAIEVRTPAHLDGVEALIMPGGESTTMSMLLESSGLFDPIAERLKSGLGVFGTCAGLILLASEVRDGRPDQRSFGRLDIAVQRNGYGRQLQSFEATMSATVLDEPFHTVFIRAPKILRVGQGVEVLAASADGDPVLVRDGSALGAVFHPELADDTRIHRLFLDTIGH